MGFKDREDLPDTISLRDFHRTMKVFYPKLTMRETEWIIGEKDSVSMQHLYNVLKNNKEDDFDPVAEAFQILPKLEGHSHSYVDMDKLCDMYQELGFEGVNKKVIKLMVQRVMKEHHRKIDLDAFR